MDKLWCVVMLRGIAAAKMRLQPMLEAGERAALNRFLLKRTLGVVTEFLGNPARAMVVSRCPEATQIAASAGAIAYAEPPGADLSAAALAGVAAACARGANRLLLLPCDLPELTAAALEQFMQQSAVADMGIAPDEACTGTNALALRPTRMPRFAFGPGSFRHHCDYARVRGWHVATCSIPALAFDLDTPADLARWRSRPLSRKPGRVEYAPLI